MKKANFEKNELSGDREVIKNNQLIEAHYRLSAGEQKLVLTLCSKIKSDDVTFKEFELKISEFLELLGINNGGKNYRNINVICKKLVSRVLNLDTGNGFKVFSWLHHVEYIENKGTVLVQFHEYLAPYLLYVKNNIYTKYKLGMVLHFKSEYSIRIYELMKQIFPRIKSRTIQLKDLKKMLGIEQKEYTLYSNFKNKVIKKAQKEINEKSDIEIEIHEHKHGRKVVALTFIIDKNYKNTTPIENWYDYQKYKAKSIEDLSEIFCDMLKEKYKVDISPGTVTMYKNTSLLSTIFELKEGYYKNYTIKNPALYFLKILDNKDSN